jgi:hypothetical protein
LKLKAYEVSYCVEQGFAIIVHAIVVVDSTADLIQTTQTRREMSLRGNLELREQREQSLDPNRITLVLDFIVDLTRTLKMARIPALTTKEGIIRADSTNKTVTRTKITVFIRDKVGSVLALTITSSKVLVNVIKDLKLALMLSTINMKI